jgi:hypothetical protein
MESVNAEDTEAIRKHTFWAKINSLSLYLLLRDGQLIHSINEVFVIAVACLR